MRLRACDKRDVTVFAWTGMDDDMYTWGEKRIIRAAVYPKEQRLEARVYGEGCCGRRILLYDGTEALEAGMGVSLDGGTPSLRIVSVERWAHVRAVLEEIPERRRGTVG